LVLFPLPLFAYGCLTRLQLRNRNPLPSGLTLCFRPQKVRTRPLLPPLV
jgi:hypothetical protein